MSQEQRWEQPENQQRWQQPEWKPTLDEIMSGVDMRDEVLKGLCASSLDEIISNPDARAAALKAFYMESVLPAGITAPDTSWVTVTTILM